MWLPEILNTWFIINEKKLWEIDIPVDELNISEIEYNLDIPYLEKIWTNDWNLTPRELIKNFGIETLHAAAVEKADLKYPIEIYFHKWVWIILDWVHRFTKAIRSWNKSIKVRKISDEIINIVKRSPEEYKKRKWE